MKKPPDNLTITIIGPDDMKPEDAQKLMDSIRRQHEQEKRDWEIYQRGVRDGSGGILGVFGL